MGRPRPHIIVVGLGPAGSGYLTSEVRALLATTGRAFVRTAQHPALEGLSGLMSFDDLYDTADTFAEVYRAIVEKLVQAAQTHDPASVVYAVPGSPLVAERTVELLRNDDRVDLTIIPALSFLDLAWDRLGIDPLGAGVQLVDAERFALGDTGDRGPYLVAQCWSQSLLSEIKLAPSYDEDAPVPDVVLLHHLGLDDEQVISVAWWDLDRTLQPDHLTSLYIPSSPRAAELGREIGRLDGLVATLRERCPWDKVQTHGSLMPHLLEESYEVLDALRGLDNAQGAADGAGANAGPLADALQEELGDLLFQIVFHARLAQEEGVFTLADVARGVREKLVHRHPHVFGEGVVATAQQVVANWEEIKREEKGRSSVTEGIPADLPALLLSSKLQKKALSVGMAGLGLDDASRDLAARIALFTQSEIDPTEAKEIVGEVLFTVASFARGLGIDPEEALRSRALTLRDAIVEYEEASAGLRQPEAPTH